MCGGGKTKTSTSSTQALPQYADAYSKLLGQAQTTASTPWNPATGQQVAGFTAPQTQAFGLAQSNLGAWQPDFSAANASVAQGTTPITTNSIINNPLYQQQVDAINNASNLAQGQTTSAVNANAAKIGALTGDRSQIAVGQALAPITAAQQTALANAASNTFGQTLGAQEFNNQAALQGAGIYGNLASQAQNLGLTDISSLLGIGNQQQQQQQNVNNANTANAQAQAQYPFATTQWLASLATGLGGAAGSQSSQTQPGPNLWSQLLGGGLAAASLFHRGGRVGYDSGGAVTGSGMPYGDAPSYVPTMQMPHGGMNHQGPMPSIDDQTGGGMSDVLNNFKQAHSAFQGLGGMGAKAFNWANTTTDPNSGWSTTTTPTGMSGFSNWLGNTFGFADGGPVRHGYADGGDVTDLVDDGTGTYSTIGSNLSHFLPAANDASPWATTVSRAQASPVARPAHAAASLPAPSGLGAMVAPAASSAAPQAIPYELPTTPWLFGARLSDPARQGLLAAGLGMMASQSPWVGTAIGEGGLQGVGTYNQTRQQAIENTQAKQRVDIQAQELAQRAKQAAEQLKLGYAQLGSEAPLRSAQVANLNLETQNRRAAIAALSSPDVLKPYIGTPYESVARAAAASGNAEALSNINREMAQYGMLPMGAGLPSATTGTGSGQVPLDDYLKSIPDPLVRGQAGSVLRGETTLQNLTSRSPGIAAQVQRLVYNYDPTFDPQAAVRRKDYREQLQKGPIQVQRQAIGTMFEHLNTAADLAQKVDPGTMPIWNAAKNTWNTQTGDDRANNLAIALNNYATEYAKLIQGKPPTEGEVAETRSMLHNAMSGKQLSGGLATLQELAEGRIHELQSQGDVILGKYKTDNDSVLSPNAQKAIERANSNRWLHPNAGPPAEAVKELRQNANDPIYRASFDKHFGVGAAAQILGGQ